MDIKLMNAYPPIVSQYFHDRRHTGELILDTTAKKGMGLIRKGEAGLSENGDHVIIQLQTNTQGYIINAVFKAHGGVATIACCAWLTEWLIDKSIDEAMKLTEPDIRNALQLSPLKRHSSLLAYEAVRQALIGS